MSRPPKTHPPKNLTAGTDAPPGSFELDAEDRVEAVLDAEDAFEEADSGADLGFDEAAGGARLKAGVAVIRHFWQTLPNGPGVYRMIDSAGDVLYVGKARSLKKRVASYTRGIGHTNRIARMISETAAMEFVTTQTETEALLLEANLIKQLKPRFNVLLRDDKSFPYILITGDHVSPQLTKHRGARNRQGDYFGPFASVWAVNRTLNALQRAFLLRSCTDSYYENRTRPCLLHQIKRCSGPCTGEVGHVEYARLVAQARDFLRGKSQGVKQALAGEMQRASDELEFERAARYRDRLAALSAIQASQDINPQSVEEADVFALHEEAGQFCIEVFFFRNFQNWGNRAYFPKADRSIPTGEVHERLHRPVLRRQADAPPRAALARDRGTRTAGRGAERPRGLPGRGRRAPARREARPGGARLHQCPRGAGPAARRHLVAAQAAGRHGPGVRIGRTHPARRGLRQLAHHGHQCRRRDGRGRAAGLLQAALPHLQHPLGRNSRPATISA